MNRSRNICPRSDAFRDRDGPIPDPLSRVGMTSLAMTICRNLAKLHTTNPIPGKAMRQLKVQPFIRRAEPVSGSAMDECFGVATLIGRSTPVALGPARPVGCDLARTATPQTRGQAPGDQFRDTCKITHIEPNSRQFHDIQSCTTKLRAKQTRPHPPHCGPQQTTIFDR